MQVSSINTLSDLIVSETLKGNVELVNKITQLPGSSLTFVHDAIRQCIDEERTESVDLMIFLSNNGFTIGGYSPFEYTLLAQKFKMAESMLKIYPDINSNKLMEKCDKPIIFVIKHCVFSMSESLKFILKYNPDLNVRYGDDRKTPLLGFMEKGRYDEVQLLLDAGADLEMTDDSGSNAMDYCDKYPHENSKEFKEKLRSMIKRETLEDIVRVATRRNDMELAYSLKSLQLLSNASIADVIKQYINRNEIERIKQIAGNELKTIIKDEVEQWSLLWHCLVRGKFDFLDYFLKQGIDINLRNTFGRTLLSEMLIQGLTHDSFDCLINNKIAINLATDQGNTPLMLAISYNRYIIANKLLDMEADITPINSDKQTSLSICKDKNDADTSLECEKLLKRLEKLRTNGYNNVTETKFKCVSDDGDVIEIPKTPKTIIRAYQSETDGVAQPVTHLVPIAGDIHCETLCDDDSWPKMKYLLPKCYIQIPVNFVAACHVIPAGVIGDKKIVKFMQFTYV
jgi:ankyrin repeat protein